MCVCVHTYKQNDMRLCAWRLHCNEPSDSAYTQQPETGAAGRERRHSLAAAKTHSPRFCAGPTARYFGWCFRSAGVYLANNRGLVEKRPSCDEPCWLSTLFEHRVRGQTEVISNSSPHQALKNKARRLSLAIHLWQIGSRGVLC